MFLATLEFLSFPLLTSSHHVQVILRCLYLFQFFEAPKPYKILQLPDSQSVVAGCARLCTDRKAYKIPTRRNRDRTTAWSLTKTMMHKGANVKAFAGTRTNRHQPSHRQSRTTRSRDSPTVATKNKGGTKMHRKAEENEIRGATHTAA